MRSSGLGFAAALLVVGLLGAAPAAAQSAPGGGAATTEPSKPKRGAAKRTTREPTVGQMAARERQKKCGAEWREAKAGNRTGGLKWPQYYSRCNARLKGNSA